MPAHKRSLSENRDDDDDPIHHRHAKHSRHEPQFHHEEPPKRYHREDEDEDEDEEEEEEPEPEGAEAEVEVEEDSEDTASSGTDEKPEFVTVELPEIRKDVQCPICLGIIKKTRTVMECLHRFCRECIDKSMRLGNNECPACRTHCASRRSLRDDPNYDALIAALYPDIDKYDEEELAFHEEERIRNKQIQAAIAQISQRQTEALVRRRALGKDTTGAFTTRSQRRNIHSRRRRNYRGNEQGSEDNEDENYNNEGKYSSSADERCTEVRQRRYRRHPGGRPSQPSPSAANSDGGCLENDIEASKEGRGLSPGLVWNPEMLAWGRGGARSNTRHSGSSNKSSRTSRISKLADYLRSFGGNTDELDVHIMLVSSDTKRTPSLQQPYLCCRPCSTVRNLCDYIACKTPLRAEDIEMLAVRGNDNLYHDKPILNPSSLMNDPDPISLLVNQCKDNLRILEGQETLACLIGNCTLSNHHMIVAYRQKENT